MRESYVSEDGIPSDDDVLAIVTTAPAGGISPGDLLQQLMDQNKLHTRANSQRAMQRALDRDKIKFNIQLKLELLRQAA